MGRARKKPNKKRAKYIMLLIVVMLFLTNLFYTYNHKMDPPMAEAAGDNISEPRVEASDETPLAQEETTDKKEEAEKLEEKEEVDQVEVDQAEESQDIAEDGQSSTEDVKQAYLTFDDGPSPNITPQILDTLEEYNIKGTFFVIGNMAEQYPDIVERMDKEGHSIGNHSYSHSYGYIYRTTSNFINEIKKTEKVLEDILDGNYNSKAIRFPGGSFGDKKKVFRDKAQEEGYVYYDWNALNGDAEGKNKSKGQLVQRFKDTFNGQSELVILMHDMSAKQTTADALPDIIEFLQEQGYSFDVLK